MRAAGWRTVSKVLLASDLSRRWTLAEIAAQIRGSPVYLTQVFPSDRRHSPLSLSPRLRLARALDLIAQYDDLSALAAELGFSSHSHFTAAFRQAVRPITVGLQAVGPTLLRNY